MSEGADSNATHLVIGFSSANVVKNKQVVSKNQSPYTKPEQFKL
jgi:hypothetical protein